MYVYTAFGPGAPYIKLLEAQRRGLFWRSALRAGAKRRRFQVPIFRGGHRGRKKVGNRKIRKKRIAKRCKACYNALCVRPKGAAPTLGCRQAVRHQTLTLAFVGSNPAIPAKSDPLAQLAEQLPFKQWVRGSNPRRVTKKKDTTFVVSFFLDAAPFGISMPCRSKPSLRNCLVLRTCEFTAHQRRRSEDRSDISIAQILTVPSTSEQALYRLLRLIL